MHSNIATIGTKKKPAPISWNRQWQHADRNHLRYEQLHCAFAAIVWKAHYKYQFQFNSFYAMLMVVLTIDKVVQIMHMVVQTMHGGSNHAYRGGSNHMVLQTMDRVLQAMHMVVQNMDTHVVLHTRHMVLQAMQRVLHIMNMLVKTMLVVV